MKSFSFWKTSIDINQFQFEKIGQILETPLPNLPKSIYSRECIYLYMYIVLCTLNINYINLIIDTTGTQTVDRATLSKCQMVTPMVWRVIRQIPVRFRQMAQLDTIQTTAVQLWSPEHKNNIPLNRYSNNKIRRYLCVDRSLVVKLKSISYFLVHITWFQLNYWN